eukprot:3128556-Pyramimonas_sp.AAC.1
MAPAGRRLPARLCETRPLAVLSAGGGLQRSAPLERRGGRLCKGAPASPSEALAPWAIGPLPAQARPPARAGARPWRGGRGRPSWSWWPSHARPP